MCSYCHKAFHKEYGNGKKEPNTREQMDLFRSTLDTSPKEVIILTGVSGSGKSWVSAQLDQYIRLDTDKAKDICLKLYQHSNKPFLIEATACVSTWIKRLSQIGHNVKLVVIIEDNEAIKQRILARGGKGTKGIARRAKRMEVLRKRAVFSGSSVEVLNFLQNT
jgi:2-phosphoglycerate kinase